MLFRYVFVLLITLLCVSCSSSQTAAYKDFQITDRLKRQYTRLMKNEDCELHVVADSNATAIREVIVFYRTKKLHLTSIEEARNLIVAQTEEFSAIFNEDKHIRSYLHNFPFGAKNLTLGIGFIDGQNNYLLSPCIAGVRQVKGMVYYFYWDIHKKDFEIIHSESYDHALSIYKNLKQCSFTKNQVE